MKREFTQSVKTGMVVLGLALCQLSAKAVGTFTAVASGNFSSNATWGGVAPSNNLTLDNIVIPSGINVVLDQNVTINGALSTMDVDGSLTSNTNTALVFTGGVLGGSGTIDVDSLVLKATSGLTFTGDIIADDMTALAAGLTTSANVAVSNQLLLGSGSLDFLTNSSLILGNNATIVVAGGTISNSNGTFNLSGNYNVVYNTASATTGLELSGSGLQNVTIDVPSGSSVTLAGDITVKGQLDLRSGSLVLSGNDLTLTTTGTVASGGTGTIVSSMSSNITINSTSGTGGILRFGILSASAVNNLNISVGSPARISGVLNVNGTLTLTSGTLDISDADITISGNLMGSGNLFGNNNTHLAISTSTTLGSNLSFASGGQIVNDLDINIVPSGSVTLGTDLTVTGELNVAVDNQFNISDRQLTVNGSINNTSTGTLTTNSGSGLRLTTALPTQLRLTGTNGTIGTLAFDGSGNTQMTLTGDLTISTLLDLKNGGLILNTNDLNILGDIAAGSGGISSSAASSITVQSNSALSGSLKFNSNANTVDNFTLNLNSGNSLTLGSAVLVSGDLVLQNGTLDLDANDVTVLAGGTISGGSSNSYLITDGGGKLNIAMAANDSATFYVGTSTQYAPAMVVLNNGSGNGKVSVNVDGDVMSQGTSGIDLSTNQALVDATWHVESDITSNLNLDLKVMWSAGLEVNGFNRSSAHLSHFTGGNWDSQTKVAATAEANSMFSLRRDGLASLSPFAVFGENAVGIKDVANVEFGMYPNPAADHLVINYTNATKENMMVDIMDATGKVISTNVMTADKYNVPVATFANGTYFARVYNSNASTVKSFSKF